MSFTNEGLLVTAGVESNRVKIWPSISDKSVISKPLKVFNIHEDKTDDKGCICRLIQELLILPKATLFLSLSLSLSLHLILFLPSFISPFLSLSLILSLSLTSPSLFSPLSLYRLITSPAPDSPWIGAVLQSGPILNPVGCKKVHIYNYKEEKIYHIIDTGNN